MTDTECTDRSCCWVQDDTHIAQQQGYDVHGVTTSYVAPCKRYMNDDVSAQYTAHCEASQSTPKHTTTAAILIEQYSRAQRHLRNFNSTRKQHHNSKSICNARTNQVQDRHSRVFVLRAGEKRRFTKRPLRGVFCDARVEDVSKGLGWCSAVVDGSA